MSEMPSRRRISTRQRSDFKAWRIPGRKPGVKDRASYAIRQNKLTLLLTTPIRSNNPIADHIYKHGDGVKALALKVEDATSAWEETTKRGGKSYMEPKTLSDEAWRGRDERNPHLRRCRSSVH